MKKTAKYPIVIIAPHACCKISDPKIKERLLLNDYEIFKFSDPYTNELNEFTCAAFKHIGKSHRLICDLNRAPNLKSAFHTKDFFGRTVFKPNMEFTRKEKEIHLAKHWWPFHDQIVDSIYELDEEAHEIILVVDYHNTSGDHPLNFGQEYMPSIIISNLGNTKTANLDECQLVSIPNRHLEFLSQNIANKLDLGVEMNTIYQGGYNVLWIKQMKENLDINAKIYAIQIEYNLDYVFHPITKEKNEKALKILQTAFNESLILLYERLWADQYKTTK